MHIALHDTFIMFKFYIFEKCTVDVPGEEDASTLAAGFRLHDECLGLALLTALVVGLELRVLCREVPGNGEKLILGGEFAPESHQALP